MEMPTLQKVLSTRRPRRFSTSSSTPLSLNSVVFDFLNDFAGLCVARVDDLRVMRLHLTDQSLGLQLLEGKASQTSTNFEPLGNDGRSDQLVGRNFLHELVECWFVEEDEIVEFVPDFSLGPLLLLRLSAAAFLGLLRRRWRRLLSVLSRRLRWHLLPFDVFCFLPINLSFLFEIILKRP